MPPRRRWVSLVCAFAATWSLIGCANLQRWRDNGFKVGPNYARPLAPADPQYLDVDDPRVVPQPAGDALWWRSFNDPTLEGLIEAAYQQNLSLRAAGLRVLEARRERDIAAGTLFPQEQGLFGAGTRALLSDETATANPLSPRRFSQFETNFNLTWEIDVWGRIRRAIESADAAVDLTVEDYDDLLVTLVSDVAVAYFELRGFDERIRLAKQNVVLQAGSLKIVEARKEAGAVSELDLKEAELNLADTLASIPVLQQGRRQTVNRLAVLLGMTPGQLAPILEATAPLPEPPTEVFVSVPADLLRRRPDVRSAERQVAVQSAQIGIAEAELYPRFVLAGDIGFSAGNIADLTRDGATAGSISPGFSWSILNYGRLVNAIRVEELRFQQTVLAYENAVLTAHQEAEDAVVAFLRTGEQVEYLERSAAAAARSVELALTRYREGEIDFSRVFVLESSLVARQDQLVAAQSQRAIAAANVYRALGGGWEIRLQQPYAGRAPLPLVPQTDWLPNVPGKQVVDLLPEAVQPRDLDPTDLNVDGGLNGDEALDVDALFGPDAFKVDGGPSKEMDEEGRPPAETDPKRPPIPAPMPNQTEGSVNPDGEGWKKTDREPFAPIPEFDFNLDDPPGDKPDADPPGSGR